MQVIEFASGHKHIHKIRLDSYKSTYSAYFAPNGILVDAARIDAIGREHPVSKAQKQGLVYKCAHLFPPHITPRA